ncbi:uncharacterized protein MELLADRAFT_101485 [Melampsora larici-populina 98AG31]|uniref:Uncharacterized protein n=1 Tax=Melampsora larici-populina (strain 98AG31 / pathotype 3-4-7) TaxID=747676 RepID=F4R4X0_MELLP|nr:uncharacterized protein MELLADRAFT_101485 [Melampsora larici-populina 98AG31]EGG12923.1 hypothetical protein MELLADRAFT_101485 [Melampsora larici-populina 98AG31]
MPPKATRADPRRVPCQCRISGCYKSVYIDAHGISQRGVEVLPATKEAHERAELRSRIQSLSLSPSHGSAISSGSPGIDLRDDLIGPLTNLGIGVPNERTPTRSASRPTFTPVVLDSNGEQSHSANDSPDILATSTSESLEDSNRLSNMINESTNTSTNADLGNRTQILDPDVSAAASIAREKGLDVYDCSHFHKFSLKAFNPVCLHIAVTAAVLSIFDHASICQER